MRKRDYLILGIMMACFTGALFVLIVIQGQTNKRSAHNVERLCNVIVELTGKPCELQAPLIERN